MLDALLYSFHKIPLITHNNLREKLLSPLYRFLSFIVDSFNKILNDYSGPATTGVEPGDS